MKGHDSNHVAAGTTFAILPHVASQQVCVVSGNRQYGGDGASVESPTAVIAAQSLVFARTDDAAAATTPAVPQMRSPSAAAAPEASAERSEHDAVNASVPMRNTVAVKAVQSVKATADATSDGSAKVREAV